MGCIVRGCSAILSESGASTLQYIYIRRKPVQERLHFWESLAEYIPDQERVVTIEDSAELRLYHIQNLVRLESRNASQEGKYEVTIRDLIRNSTAYSS